MSLRTITRAECESCRKTLTLNVHDELRALDMLKRMHWVIHQWDIYGNYSTFCCETCRDVVLAKMLEEYRAGSP